MGVEASSLNGIITLCIENKAEMPGLAGMIRTAFEKRTSRCWKPWIWIHKCRT